MVKRQFKKDKKIFFIFAILLVAIFSATAFLFLNPKKVYAESGMNNQETLTEIDYNAYTDSDFLINDNEKTIFDYPEMFAQKSKIEVEHQMVLFFIKITFIYFIFFFQFLLPPPYFYFHQICLLSLFNFCWYFLIEFKTLLIIYIFW